MRQMPERVPGRYRRISMRLRGRVFETPRAVHMINARIRNWHINWQ